MDNVNSATAGPCLGAAIRQLRISRGLKVVDVAKATGLTSSLISQVEHSKIAPSIETLKKIAAALDTPLGTLFVDSPASERVVVNRSTPVVHPDERKRLSPGKGVVFQLLNPDMSGPLEFIYNTYEPGASTGNRQYTHPGTECGLVLQGQLLVTIDDEEYLLNAGDSITFSSERPHSKSNPGDTPCHCVWANTPPWF